MNRYALAGLLLVLTSATSAPTNAMQALDTHDIAVKALSLGAAASRDKDAGALAEADRLLGAVGARPAPGSRDAAQDWRRQRSALTGKEAPRPPMRGRALGSAYKLTTLASGGALRLEQIFLAGRKAKVSLVPTEGGELGLLIVGDDGKPLCARNVVDQPASCSWLPAWTTRYRIEVRNPGRRVSSLFLVIN